VERLICLERAQECLPVHIRYTVLSVSESKDIDMSIHLGAMFPDLQPLPGLGAWHGSECKSILSVGLAL
jgi:hypothetical protein